MGSQSQERVMAVQNPQSADRRANVENVKEFS